jgi:hypothetical protein
MRKKGGRKAGKSIAVREGKAERFLSKDVIRERANRESCQGVLVRLLSERVLTGRVVSGSLLE